MLNNYHVVQYLEHANDLLGHRLIRLLEKDYKKNFTEKYKKKQKIDFAYKYPSGSSISFLALLALL
jgi:hypothetical protein